MQNHRIRLGIIARAFYAILFLAALATVAFGQGNSAADIIARSTSGRFKAAQNAQVTPNVVFIMADDLGYGDLGCYGQQQLQTPRIDQLAAEGVRFTDYYAGSTVCAPSRCVLMTGMHTGHCFIRGNGRQDLPSDQFTVAELFKQHGYATGMFGKWGLGENNTGLPNNQGFDEFFGYLNQGHAHNYYPTHLFRTSAAGKERVPLHNVVPNAKANGAGKSSNKVEYSHDLIMAEALNFLDRNHDKPFFLYMPVTIPHANNEAGREGMEVPELGEFVNKDWPEPQKGFAAMLQKLDADVGRVLDKLSEHGIAENTVVIFTSDNGPHREGGNNPQFFDSNGPLRGIKRALYEGGIRVPFIVRYPGKITPGSETIHIGSFADLLPTAADLLGADTPAGIDGISIAPIIRGEAESQQQHEYLYWEFYEQGSRQAVRAGKWKAVREPMLTGEIQLFDLETDLGEENDIAEQNPEIVKRMEQFMVDAHTPSPDWKVPAQRK